MKEEFAKIISAIGEDLTREGLSKTPERAAKAMEYLTGGYSMNLEKVVNGAIFTTRSEEMIIVKDIEIYSLCEHHLLPFFGKCHVGYIPNGKVIGLSKVARIVDMFSRRLQIQEELTRDVAEAVRDSIGALGVGVVIQAQHLCMMMRGVEKQNSKMLTSAMLGNFRRDERTRNEFISLIGHGIG